MHRFRSTALILALAFMASATACTASSESQPGEAGMPEATRAAEQVAAAGETAAEAPPEETGVQTFYDAFREYSGNEGSLESASSFCDGAAWVYMTDASYSTGYNGHHAVYAINTQGEVIFTLYEEGMKMTLLSDVTGFCRGASFIKNTTNAIYDLNEIRDALTGEAEYPTEENDSLLIDTSGNVIWSLNRDGLAEGERIFGAGSI